MAIGYCRPCIWPRVPAASSLDSIGPAQFGVECRELSPRSFTSLLLVAEATEFIGYGMSGPRAEPVGGQSYLCSHKRKKERVVAQHHVSITSIVTYPGPVQLR